MKISFESELMKNQKHAVVMAPDRAFEVLQSQDGDALFFSIGTDGVFYLTREVTASETGWTRLDLGAAITAAGGGTATAAKAFSVAQNARTLAIDIALVVTVGGADQLYLSLGNANTDAAWGKGVSWTAVPFDAGKAPSPLTIADVLVMNIPAAGGGATENIFVDIVRSPGDPLGLLDRYYISPGGSPKWNPHKLAADLAAGSISSCLGNRAGDPVPGIYTFGTIGGTQELIFTPQYNYFRPAAAPSPARLTLPAGASAIASALDGSGVSNLFVAATDGLYLFAAGNQHDQATGVLVVPSGLAAGASALAAATDANRTAVWGVDPQGYLFYAACPAGKEADPAAWSHPVPLLPAAESFAFYLNLNAGNNVLFAHVDGQNLVQLTQDPVTTDWRQRSILLPAADVTDVVEYNTFTTHIQVTDDYQVPAPKTAVAVTATSPVSVYVENVYHVLSPTVPVQVSTDATGTLTVVQETQSLSAVCLRVALAGTPAVVAEINPMTKALATLGTIASGSDLGAVQVANPDGSTQPLVPSTVSASDKDAAAKSIKQFAAIGAGLPQDGSRKAPATVAAARTAAAVPAVPAAPAAVTPSVWGLSFGDAGMTYHEEGAVAQNLSPRVVAASAAVAASPGDFANAIEVAVGDFFSWLEGAFDQVTEFVVQVADDVYNFFATIANEVYHVVLDCIDAVVHAVEFVFNKIAVFFEDLIKWLGFIFEWGDILRTHKVLKNIFNQYVANSIDTIGGTRAQLQDCFTQAQDFINSWAGIQATIPPDLAGGTVNGTTSSAPAAPGTGSPQANYGIYQTKSNVSSAAVPGPGGNGLTSEVMALFDALLAAVEREGEVLQAAFDSFKTNIVDKITELSFVQIMEGVIAIFADALLQSLENVMLAAIDVMVALAHGFKDALNATIDIPVISWLYRQIADADLSLLDLICLIAAIPATIIYKLVANAAPFPDDATSTALIDATSWAGIQQVVNPARPQAAIAARAVAADTPISNQLNNVLGLTAAVVAWIGTLGVNIATEARAIPNEEEAPPRPIAALLGVSYLAYVAPDIFGTIQQDQNLKWWAIMNTIVASFMVVKVGVDVGSTFIPMDAANFVPTETDPGRQAFWDGKLSPALDAVGNIIWEIPVIGAIVDPDNHNAAGGLSFVGNTAFDATGPLSPVLAAAKDPETKAGLVLAIQALNAIYAIMGFAAAMVSYFT